MSWPAGIAVLLATVIFMEGIALCRAPLGDAPAGWSLHASHHRPRHGNWKWNDLYAAISAVPSFVLMLGGLQFGWWPGFVWIGAGIAAYAAIYFGFHDVVVHRRLPTRYLPKSSYSTRIIQAHRLHHAVETGRGTVSLGFLWAPDPADLKAEPKRRDRAGVRAPRRAGSVG